MAFHFRALPASFSTVGVETGSAKYSYSRRRWDAFEVWQEHVRKSAAAATQAARQVADALRMNAAAQRKMT